MGENLEFLTLRGLEFNLSLLEYMFLMSDDHSKITVRAFMWSSVLGTPFWVMLNTLTVILYKEFHISPFLVTLLIALEPATALAATYWSCFFSGKNKNFILTNLIRFFPFLFFFFTDSAWFPILCFSIYMSLSRGSMPIWLNFSKIISPTNPSPKCLLSAIPLNI